MTSPTDPQQPSDDTWAAYEPTQVRPQIPPGYGGPATADTGPDYGSSQPPIYGTPDPAAGGYQTPGYPAAGYPDPYAAAGSAGPYPGVTPYAAPYPGSGAAGYGAAGYPPPAAAAAPQTAQVSSVISLVISGLLVITCYGAVAGAVPLILSILAVAKSSSVNRLWLSGQARAAQDAADASKKLAMWAWITLAVGIVLTVVALVGFFVWLSGVEPSTGYTYGT